MRITPVFSPSIPEQQKIIQFCVASEKKLRKLEKNLETQISLLEEKRSALIMQVVTKGLNPDLPLKDSGINWFGEIPSHWKIKRLKQISKIVTGNTPSMNEPDNYEDGSYLWVKYSMNGFVASKYK